MNPNPPTAAIDIASVPSPTIDPQQQAATLLAALPFLQRFVGKVVVIKFGGNAMVQPDLMDAFADDIVFLRTVGIHPVVVHGGGPQISEMLSRLGIESRFVAGYRETTPEAMEVVRMVLTGSVSRDLVGRINRRSTLAVGYSGEDGGLFTARKRYVRVDGVQTDIGLVGDIVDVNPSPLHDLLSAGRIPVVSSIAPSGNGANDSFNINADEAAAALAIALKAEKLIILTDVQGLYRDWPDKDSLVTDLRTSELKALLPALESGMIPKMRSCLVAVESGVPKAAVIDGRVAHSTLLEIFTKTGFGTEVTP